MTLRVEDALENNLAWYRAVMDAHGIVHATETDCWYAMQRVPRYYSNLVTRTPNGVPAQVARIRVLADRPPAQTWSVADDFAQLDGQAMGAMGLVPLLEAVWMGTTRSSAGPNETDLEFEPLRDAGELADWETRWQRWSPTDGARVFPTALLHTPGVACWTARRHDVAVGGAITHTDDHALGLSNVFIEDAAASGAHLRDAARLALRVADGRPVVGYGSSKELGDLCALGFESIGPKRVWWTGSAR